jgi:hypothetical protein
VRDSGSRKLDPLAMARFLLLQEEVLRPLYIVAGAVWLWRAEELGTWCSLLARYTPKTETGEEASLGTRSKGLKRELAMYAL